MSKTTIKLAFALLASFACSESQAQLVPPPDVPAPELADDATTRAQIVEALRNAKAAREAERSNEPGKTGSGDGAPNSGDMVLDDVLEIIRRRGSVLDGSSLDPANDDAPLIINLPPEPRSGDVPASSAVYDAAEQLLRSARLLEKLSRTGDSSIDEDRAKLVRSMRSQAGRLLIQAIVRDADSMTPASDSLR